MSKANHSLGMERGSARSLSRRYQPWNVRVASRPSIVGAACLCFLFLDDHLELAHSGGKKWEESSCGALNSGHSKDKKPSRSPNLLYGRPHTRFRGRPGKSPLPIKVETWVGYDYTTWTPRLSFIVKGVVDKIHKFTSCSTLFEAPPIPQTKSILHSDQQRSFIPRARRQPQIQTF